ncbi:MAG: anion transporter [Gemmataceae bacterium]
MAYALVLVVFVVTYVLLALGRIPGLKTDRAGIALLGAASVLGLGLLSFEQAFSAQVMDYKTLVLLFGLMIVVGAVRLGGLFARAERLLRIARTPMALLAGTIMLAGVLSAFLVNDIICVAFTPLLLAECRRRGYDPLPHLLGLATGSNIGSAAAITGNPQNMYIGANSGIGYLRFLIKLGPPALLSLLVAFLLLAWLHRDRLRRLVATSTRVEALELPPLHSGPLVLAAVAVAGFFVLPSSALPIVALVAAALSFLRRSSPRKLLEEVDGSLLLLFAGLFIVVGAFRQQVLPYWSIESWTWLQRDPLFALSGLSVLLSNLVSNVPAVMLFRDLIETMPESQRETAWLALSLSSTLAGNLTLLGSIANLIVAEGARREGVEITFLEYAKVGVPLTLMTLVIGIGWLALLPY